MIRAAVFCIASFNYSVAWAHTASEPLSDSTWTLDPKITIPLALSLGLYVTGVFKLWRSAGVGKGIRRSQVRCFTWGWCFLFIALVSPLHWLGEQLFAAHMVEHEILMVVSAPLIVIARPFGAMMWGLPRTMSVAVAQVLRSRPVATSWTVLIGPRLATLLHGLAIWAWHMPKLFDAALENSWLHWIQHLSFLLTSLLFWWALLRSNARQKAYGMSVFLLFVTMLHCSLLGVLITLARHPLYSSQPTAFGWGISPMEDQQAAGLVMWIPAGLVYVIAALTFASHWTKILQRPEEGRRECEHASDYSRVLQP